MELFELTALPTLSPHVRELMLLAIPFAFFALLAAAVSYLARDLLAKPKPNGQPGGNGSSNGHAPHKSKGQEASGSRHLDHAYGAEMAIPTLAQHTADDGASLSTRIEMWFARLLYESGASFSREVAFMTELAGGLVVGGLLFLWLGNILFSVIGFFAGMGAVVGMYVLARFRRQRLMREQLPELIEHIARAVRAGQTVDQAIHLVGETAPSPLGIEFRRCAGQLNMGLSVDAAMKALSRRVPVAEMRLLASTFVVQRRAGGNLPSTLERLAKVIRDRITYFRQFRAATAGSRMSMVVVSVTGPLVALYMVTFQREFFGHFFETSFGWLMFSLSIVFYFVGLAMMYLILKSDY